jgi:hypothetical protein
MERSTLGLDIASLVLGLWLAVSPYALGWSGNGVGLWATVVVGIAIAGSALWALMATRTLQPEWLLIALGVVAIVSPFLFGFSDVAKSAWNAFGSGLAVAVLGAVAVVITRREGRVVHP